MYFMPVHTVLCPNEDIYSLQLTFRYKATLDIIKYRANTMIVPKLHVIFINSLNCNSLIIDHCLRIRGTVETKTIQDIGLKSVRHVDKLCHAFAQQL